MKCKYDLISYLRGDLASEETKEIKRHLDQCTFCQAELKKIEQVFQLLGTVEKVEPSVDFAARVSQALDEVITPARVQTLRPFITPSWTERLRLSLQGVGERSLIYLRYSPAWAISAAVHLTLFGILALVFIGPTQQQLSEHFIIQYAPPGTPPEKLVPPSEVYIPFSDQAQPGQPEPPEPTMIEPPPYLPETTWKPSTAERPFTPLPPPTWTKRGVWLERLSVTADTKFLDALGQRAQKDYQAQARRKYDGQGTEKALAQGLKSLATQQTADGSWDVVRAGGRAEYTVGLTGLSLLVFLGEGNTHLSGPYQATMDKGIKYLLNHRQRDGLLGPLSFEGHTINYMYNHGIASFALLEDYSLTRDESLAEAAVAAVSFIIHAQNDEGGWGYTARSGINDTSVTGWQIPALRIAKALEIKGALESLRKASQWLASVTDEHGYVGYRGLNHYPNGYQALTAVGMFAQLYLGWETSDQLIEHQAKVLLENLPQLHPVGQELDNDFYYWYFGTLAMFLKGGEAWKTWNQHMKQVLLNSYEKQRQGELVVDRWSGYGGRIYTTALALLTLEVYYRYVPLTE